MTRELIRSAAFARSARRLGKKNRPALAAMIQTLEILRNDAFDARLGTHKLRGDLAGL